MIRELEKLAETSVPPPFVLVGMLLECRAYMALRAEDTSALDSRLEALSCTDWLVAGIEVEEWHYWLDSWFSQFLNGLDVFGLGSPGDGAPTVKDVTEACYELLHERVGLALGLAHLLALGFSEHDSVAALQDLLREIDDRVLVNRRHFVGALKHFEYMMAFLGLDRPQESLPPPYGETAVAISTLAATLRVTRNSCEVYCPEEELQIYAVEPQGLSEDARIRVELHIEACLLCSADLRLQQAITRGLEAIQSRHSRFMVEPTSLRLVGFDSAVAPRELAAASVEADRSVGTSALEGAELIRMAVGPNGEEYLYPELGEEKVLLRLPVGQAKPEALELGGAVFDLVAEGGEPGLYLIADLPPSRLKRLIGKSGK